MTIRILINGANGKMGKETVKALSEQADFTVVAETHKDQDLAAEINQHKPQIVIDFTNAAVAFKNAKTIIECGVHPVIGTTGLTANEIDLLQKDCAKIKLGGLIAPNFSLGALLMMKYAKEIARYFPDVEIIEMHHPQKWDSPSGTSIRTAELIAETRKAQPKKVEKNKETLPGARGALCQEIPIHSIRLPGLIAHQQIMFGGLGETLTIRHDSIDRQCFMPGVILACQKVMGLDRLVYGLEHFI